MVNEQTEVGLLVAAPGILATLVLAPFIIEVCYSARFIPAYAVLRWLILGVFLRVVCWPMVLVPHAKGNGRVFFLTELTASIVHVALIWGGVSLFGLEGTGMAFFVLYVFYTAMMHAVVHRLSLFRWSGTNLRLGLAISACVAAVFLLPRFASRGISLTVGSLVTLVVSLYCGRNLYLLVGPEWIGDFRSKLKTRLGWMKIG
jgi:PST family polysaccharide transporter